MALTTVQSGMMDSVAQYYSFKNRIINGAMSVWQRGTTSSTLNTYVADRWLISAGSSITGSRSTDVPAGFQYSLSLSGTNFPQTLQRIESLNCTDLVGQSVTISFWAKQTSGAGAASIGLQLYYVNATDNWLGSATQVGATQTFTGTTGWVQYSATFTSLPAGVANGIEPIIYANTAGSAAFLVTGVQLEKGVTATSFDYRPYTTELQLCQRYFEKSYQQSVVPGTAGQNLGGVQFPIITAIPNGYQTGQSVSYMVQKRTAPTIVVYSYNGVVNRLTLSGGTDAAANSCVPNLVGDFSFQCINNSGASISVSSGGLYQFTASAEL